MRYGYFSYRRVINAILMALLAILCLMFIIKNPLYAAEDGTWANANSVEQTYVGAGWDAGVWLASPGTPYRSTRVNAPYGATWIPVEIRGSWYTRGSGYTETMTYNLYSSDPRVANISSGDFSRGVASNPWGSGVFVYNPYGYKTAQLKVGDACQGKTGQTVTMIVGLTNTFRYKKYGVWQSGQPSTDHTEVYVSCLAPPWRVTGSSWVTKSYDPNHPNYGTGWAHSPSTIEAKPGDTVDWWHSLFVHDADMNEAIRNGIQQDIYSLETGESLAKGSSPEYNGAWRFSANFKGKKSNDWKTWAWYRGYNAANYNNTWLETIYGKSTVEQVRGEVDKFMYTRKIKHDDVGKKICQRVYWSKSSPSYSGGYLYSGYACVAVPHKYNLTPSLSVSQKTIDAGENKIAGINASFSHDGSITKTKNNDKYYTVVKYKVPKGQNLVLPAREGIVTWSGNWPCEAIKKINGSVDCQGDLVKTKHTGELQLNQSVTMLNNHTDDVLSSNLQLGDKICYVAMVSAYNQNADYHTFKTSQAQCVTVGKTPKVQVWGGDVKTEKDVKTSKSVIKDVVSSVSEKDIKKAVAQSSKHWIFGKGAHIDFQGETVVSAQAKNDVSPNIEGNEGITVATDHLGNVKFFTDGKNIYDKNGNIKVSGLNGKATTTQAAASFPIKNNKYVIVTSSAASEDNKLGKLEYTVVDVSGGGVTVVGLKNQQFGNKSGEVIGESLTIARNQDDTGYWVVVNFPGTNRMGAIAVSYEWDGNNGKVFNYVESSLGGVAGTASGVRYAPGFGSINFNNDQNKAIIAANVDSQDRNIVKVMSFDRLSGRFTNVLAEWKIYRRDDQNEKGVMYSADFSPKDNYVYVSTLHTAGKGGHAIAGMVYRYKLHSGAPMEIVSSTKKDPLPYYTDNPSEACQETWGWSSGGQIKSAPDGKMYVANKNYKYIGVIEYPDATDIKKIGWKPKGLELKGRCNSYGLPQMAAISKQLIPPSITTKTTSYGSWAEYGVIAKGSVSSASGAGLSSSYGGRSVTNESLYNKLTFANTPKFGQFSPTLTVDTYAAPKTGIDKGSLFGSVDVGALQSGNYRAGDLAISGGTLAVGRNVVIESTGTVTISGNVNYATTNDSSKLPQLVIKAKNIVIQPNVTEINAWLITDKGGYVSTCGAVANTTAWLSGINPNDCDKRLKVNGPIKAGRLFLRRTYGAHHATATKNDPNMHPGTPAEILNLRADTYMWAYNLGRNDGAIKTAHLKEMAPRY